MILLSQIGRGVEKRDDMHPLINDIRDCKTAGEIADKVFMIYHPEYYEEVSEEDYYHIEIQNVKSKMNAFYKTYLLKSLLKRYDYNEDI